MANAYVSTTGSAAYPGTVNAPTSLGTALSTAAAGDVVYLAPGVYRGTYTLTVSGTSGNVITFIGDTTNSLSWVGASAGEVRITNYGSDTANPTAATNGTLEATSRNYVTFQNLVFECYGANLRSGAVYLTSCTYFTFTACSFKGVGAQGIRINTTTTSNITVNRCSAIITDVAFASLVFVQATTSTNYDTAITLSSCLAIRCGLLWFDNGGNQSNTTGGGYRVINSTCIAGDYGIRSYTTNTTHSSSITNCFIMGITGSMLNGTTAVVTQTYNVYFGGLTNIATSATSSAVGVIPINAGEVNMQAYGSLPIIAPYITSRLRAFGTATGAPATDIYNNAWSGVTPDAGGLTYAQQGNSAYFPSERNASTISIAPGSTSQSIELYLGATGLTASTSGLSARYNRTRTASVSIPLVARTIAQAWTSGGFAEVDATTMPGVYRLDLPDAALAAGADDVTVVVRGASGTNGAVMTVKLSSGGLSSTETAQAVWNATASSYNTAGSMGEAGQRLTGYSLASIQTFSTTGSVGSVTGAVTVGTNNDKTGYALSSAANTSAADAVWNATRSTHTTAGTFGQYVNAELVTPVTQSALVRMGPFQVIADGVTTPMPLDVQKGAQHGIDIQCVDNNLSAIDITSATVTAKVYNSGGSLVDTYSCTATYAADGRATFTIDTTVTNSPGTYTATITRTTGASDTQVFGPLRIYVRDI